MAKTKDGSRVFRLGKRFQIYRTLAYILCSVVIFGFYFIYDYLLEGTQLLTTNMLLAIFLFIEVLVMFAVYKGSKWLENNYYYEVGKKGLTVVTGKNHKLYSWDKFEAVEMGNFSFVDLIPVKYTYEGKHVIFSQYLASNWEMHKEIFARIKDHVDISEELYTQVRSMSLED